jgi:cysteine synthase
MFIDSILKSIDGTPLIQLRRMSSGNVFGEAEFLNPGGSIKDRVAKHIIESTEKDSH